MNVVAVIDGTRSEAAEQARTLAGFLAEGLTGAATTETLILYGEERDGERLAALAPTNSVRLVRSSGRSPGHLAADLSVSYRQRPVDLVLLAGGPTGAEAATRLAHRTGGAVLTDVLSASVDTDRLTARRSVYSNHLIGSFELGARPWCLTVDLSWRERAADSPDGHHISGDVSLAVSTAGAADGAAAAADDTAGAADGTAGAAEHRVGAADGTAGAAEHRVGAADGRAGRFAPGDAWFDEVELVAAPSSGDLDEARFLVVAGYGAGSRAALDRIASAADRMGAAFAVTRPVAMNAWAPMDRLVGVSGVRLAPAVCVVAAASGAPAFLWGVERARLIVAVNTDEHAPIMAEADLAVVGDAVPVLEALAEEIGRASE